MSVKRRRYSKQSKFQAAIDLLSEKHTLVELSQKYSVHQTVLQRWKRELSESGPHLFDRSSKPKSEDKEIDALQRKIGQLTMELDFLKKALGK
jgi:transposase